MIMLTDKLFAYGFHDTTVTDIRFEGTKVILEFEEGLYKLDEIGKETDLTGKAEMTIYLDENKVKSSLDAVKTYANIKCRIKFVDIGEVISDSRSNCFEIENTYFNNYDNTLVIVRGLSYFLEIKYCKDVEYRFETYQPEKIKERKEINELMKYRFHNACLSHIAVKKDRVELIFSKGVYRVDDENNEIKQMDNFKLIANVDDPILLWRSTTAYIVRYGKGGEI
ncbi:MAG: hypothetical protein Q4C64_04785 [Erysipelotrichia bacterium]|nr:hypothetical protein [Erysipelotrichia bacterium]